MSPALSPMPPVAAPSPGAVVFGAQGRSFARAANDLDAPADVLGRLLSEAFEAFERDPGAARQSLSRAFALLDVEPREPAKAPNQDLGQLAPWQAKKAATYIEEHLDAPIDIGELAALVRLSQSYFSRAFKVSFGATPQPYILGRRIALAQDLMLTTEHPLCGIALDCGFSDQSHLSRIFRRLTGDSPNAWRRARRAAPGEADSGRSFNA
ncbi:AraC family transcriptional regulator [Phenylobacterium sp.]|uniref:helix-turn-helix transcriptional regulator n=1 Tax=Phenylobacterium sp. TaxID=1871053 RepID=UPI0012221F1F|nr:AraC family transcriptional regulator [Phenylobacterium sp.]THD60574.1 MAG: AraC family transcriptional regulator [Phenylobacterium sp.]